MQIISWKWFPVCLRTQCDVLACRQLKQAIEANMQRIHWDMHSVGISRYEYATLWSCFVTMSWISMSSTENLPILQRVPRYCTQLQLHSSASPPPQNMLFLYPCTCTKQNKSSNSARLTLIINCTGSFPFPPKALVITPSGLWFINSQSQRHWWMLTLTP